MSKATKSQKTRKFPKSVLDAARLYSARKERDSHPEGTFDNAGRWYPSDREWQECCGHVRSPTRAFPYSYMTHCRTAEHAANRFGVDVKEVRRAHKQVLPAERERERALASAYEEVGLPPFSGSCLALERGGKVCRRTKQHVDWTRPGTRLLLTQTMEDAQLLHDALTLDAGEQGIQGLAGVTIANVDTNIGRLHCVGMRNSDTVRQLLKRYALSTHIATEVLTNTAGEETVHRMASPAL